MRRRLQRRLEPAEQEPERAKEAAAAEIKGAGVTAMERNQKEELEQVNALYSLLEDRYKRKVSVGLGEWIPFFFWLRLTFDGLQHPVSEAFFRPASHPSHYSDLLAELEAVPKRSWLASKINKWRGFLRLQ